MPELPEVETIARTLAPSLAGRALVSINVINRKTWQGEVRSEAVCQGGPLAVLGTGRRGKLLLIYLGDGVSGRNGTDPGGCPPCTPAWLDAPRPLHPGMEAPASSGGLSAPSSGNRSAPSGGVPDIRALALHLKMTGRVFTYPADTPPGPHTRVVFGLDDGSLLFFDDVRKFGYVRVITPACLSRWDFWRTLGPEPFALDDASFAALFEGRYAAIKALLLDQKVIAGIGNIYADESLFRAGIAPSTPGGRLGAERLARLRRALVEVLEESIEACGSSIRDYRTARGDAGSFQNAFRVYGRSGQRCVNCGRKLRKAVVAGRTTVFCPHCQK